MLDEIFGKTNNIECEREKAWNETTTKKQPGLYLVVMI
jgi:hypothetical protein